MPAYNGEKQVRSYFTEQGRGKKMKSEFWMKHGYGLTVAALLTAFTGYALLDTFVIPRSYAKVTQTEGKAGVWQDVAGQGSEGKAGSGQDAAGQGSEGKAGSGQDFAGQGSEGKAGSGQDAAGQDGTWSSTAGEAGPGKETSEGMDEATLTEKLKEMGAEEIGSYEDEQIRIDLTSCRTKDTTVYVAEVLLASPEYLKTALAKETYGRNVTAATSEIAKEHDAILAINGDFYGARTSGYVIRNGALLRSAGDGNEDIVIYEDGSFDIIREDEITAQELLEKGARQVLSFGPALILDGETSVGVKEEVGKAMASNPRTAIATLGEGHYLFVVSDGRTSESEGLSLYELAEFLKALGVRTAYNLDGGGSSTMVFQGEVVNNPTTGGRRVKERSVSDIVYVGRK